MEKIYLDYEAIIRSDINYNLNHITPTRAMLDRKKNIFDNKFINQDVEILYQEWLKIFLFINKITNNSSTIIDIILIIKDQKLNHFEILENDISLILDNIPNENKYHDLKNQTNTLIKAMKNANIENIVISHTDNKHNNFITL